MKKSMFLILSIGIITFSVGSAFCLTGALEIVSPGSPTGISLIESRCPTFSWAAREGTSAYELVVYHLPEGLDPAEYQPSDDEEILYTYLPGGANTWTPPFSRSLQRGETYLWFIRALKEDGEGRTEALSDWSEGSWFMVSPGPSPEEIRLALENLPGDTVGN